jgi:hypothetical protein
MPRKINKRKQRQAAARAEARKALSTPAAARAARRAAARRSTPPYDPYAWAAAADGVLAIEARQLQAQVARARVRMFSEPDADARDLLRQTYTDLKVRLADVTEARKAIRP